jgi:hypothetical protein
MDSSKKIRKQTIYQPPDSPVRSTPPLGPQPLAPRACCTHNCDEGRDCPLRQRAAPARTSLWVQYLFSVPNKFSSRF